MPVAVLLAGLILAGCDLSAPPPSWDRYPSQIDKLAIPAPVDPLVQSQQRGRAVYNHYCQRCHGEHGAGDGFNASLLTPPPRNFTDAAFWKQATDEGLTDAITNGGKSVGKSNLMPAWGHTLDAEQIRDVIAYLSAFAAPAKQPK